MDFSKYVEDKSTKPRNIDFQTLVEFYKEKEENSHNKDFYPQSFEDRKKYITEYWFSPERMRAREIKLLTGLKDVIVPPNAKILELGSNWLTSVKWIADKYPDCNIDLIDFSEYMTGNFDVARKLFPNQIGQCTWCSIHEYKMADNTYDIINASSFWEHVPLKEYWAGLQICLRALKPNGAMIVYSDYHDGNYAEHIGVIPIEQAVEEITSVGFIAETNYVFNKPL